jgi:hypothetical protein
MGDILKILICTEQSQVVTNTQLRDQCIDCAHLNPGSTAGIAKSGRGDVVLTIGYEERQAGEVLEDLVPRLRSREALQQLLKNQACGDDRFPGRECPTQLSHLNTFIGAVAP